MSDFKCPKCDNSEMMNYNQALGIEPNQEKCFKCGHIRDIEIKEAQEICNETE